MEDLRYIVFSPYWNVPYSITTKELAPKARKDPGYLEEHHFEIVEGNGWDAAVQPVNAETIAALGSGKYRLRQQPGDWNALGKIKFIFPNAHHVYLHSTPGQQLFSRARRDFSHCCIRVEDVVGLAEYVLADKEWTPDRIREAMAADRPKRVDLAERLPVVIFYTTALMSQTDDAIHFFEDIYGHDDALDQALEAGYPFPP